ncbi:hypothetical protein [Sphingobacterium lactis]|uniref:Uncharacterized protein n=1 Tax=Sphingobacterium lactis TaxID=797291 RepID=A0A1H6CFR9_9SPHI|nr:hypothetical protein [Sphingobacterium lactis]SEG71861.1 hypothetical protein SAMN05421877_11553 [Sphingobacterium lactis]
MKNKFLTYLLYVLIGMGFFISVLALFAGIDEKYGINFLAIGILVMSICSMLLRAVKRNNSKKQREVHN